MTDDVVLAILDEPTAALGVAQTRNVLHLVRTLAQRNVAVLMITHDIEIVFAVADRGSCCVWAKLSTMGQPKTSRRPTWFTSWPASSRRPRLDKTRTKRHFSRGATIYRDPTRKMV
ncbi:MAG: hypothetical protein R2932_09135 [Caldilineaceae bacterium]